ncbi:RNA polymerase sigma factor [Amycolatopsis lurida]
MTDEPAEPPARLDRPDLVRRIGEAVADDLVSETFLIAWHQRHHYDPVRAAARSWLYGIATNLLCRAPDPVDGHAGRVAEQVDAQTAAQRLAGPLAALAPGDRDVPRPSGRWPDRACPSAGPNAVTSTSNRHSGARD